MTDSTTRLRRVSHTWASSGTVACNAVDMELHAGEIHALVGENGAGKSTLGHILAGAVTPDEGILEFHDKTVDLARRKTGLIDGMGLVRQRSLWPPNLELWEAAILGRSKLEHRRISPAKAGKTFVRTSRDLGLGDLNPKMLVEDADAAVLQRAELCAAMLGSPQIIILDEPTSAWEEGRSVEFRRLMTQFKNDKQSVLMITHRLNDVFEFADRVSIMRLGSLVWSGRISDTGPEEIIERMFGSMAAEESAGWDDSPASGAFTSGSGDRSATAMDLSGISLLRNGKQELKDISFSVHSGEILAISGLREEGLSSLEDVVSGHALPDSGSIRVHGKHIAGGVPELRKSGVRYVPSDSAGRGASLSSSLAENLALLDSKLLTRRGIMHPGRLRRWAETRRQSGGIDGSPDRPLGELSGGNVRKAILERELHGAQELLVLADPAWGLDERSRKAVHRRIRRLAAGGTAILLLASDLDEAISLGHRMGVLSDGCLSELNAVKDWSRREAAALIAGRAHETR